MEYQRTIDDLNRLIRITLSGDVRLAEISTLTIQSNELAKQKSYGILLDFRHTTILISTISAQFYPVTYISSLDKDYACIPVSLVTNVDTEIWQRFMDSAKKEQLAIELFHDYELAELSVIERLQYYVSTPCNRNKHKANVSISSRIAS